MKPKFIIGFCRSASKPLKYPVARRECHRKDRLGDPLFQLTELHDFVKFPQSS